MQTCMYECSNIIPSSFWQLISPHGTALLVTVQAQVKTEMAGYIVLPLTLRTPVPSLALRIPNNVYIYRWLRVCAIRAGPHL